MILEKYLEFTLMLLLENKDKEDRNFENYMYEHCCIDRFNKRYKELLDEFLNNYALNNTEKSE